MSFAFQELRLWARNCRHRVRNCGCEEKNCRSHFRNCDCGQGIAVSESGIADVRFGNVVRVPRIAVIEQGIVVGESGMTTVVEELTHAAKEIAIAPEKTAKH